MHFINMYKKQNVFSIRWVADSLILIFVCIYVKFYDNIATSYSEKCTGLLKNHNQIISGKNRNREKSIWNWQVFFLFSFVSRFLKEDGCISNDSKTHTGLAQDYQINLLRLRECNWIFKMHGKREIPGLTLGWDIFFRNIISKLV